MPLVRAERELIASLDDAWGFVAEPYHLGDWWPGLAAVEPDHRGLAPGARWHVRYAPRPTLLRPADRTGLLVVGAVEPPHRLRFELLADRLEAEIALAAAAPDRTIATLTVAGPWFTGLRRSVPRTALWRLHALCQTAATL
ncbi:MAG: SRPBCC family protein [Actinomycetota bacterium]|nr:SRPBCC family protein [Actinomycetota bacterium]